MVGELTGGIDGTDVDAGWIKLAVSDEAITDNERKVLRAAAASRPEERRYPRSH